jgi:hypothetical protein
MDQDAEDRVREPGYALGFLLIGILIGLMTAAAWEEPMDRGPGAVLNGTWMVTLGLMFLASFWFSHKTFFFRGLMWVCEHLSHPEGRGMAFFYFILCASLGTGSILVGLGVFKPH